MWFFSDAKYIFFRFLYVNALMSCQNPPFKKTKKKKKPHTHSHTMTRRTGWQYQCNPTDYTTIQLQSCSFTDPYPIWIV